MFHPHPYPDLKKKTFLCELKNFGSTDLAEKRTIPTNLKLQQNSVNQIFNHRAFFFFLLTGASWYYHAIYIVNTYFASFTGYEDDILKLFQFQIKFAHSRIYIWRKIWQIWQKIFFFFKSTPRSSWSWFFPSLSLSYLDCLSIPRARSVEVNIP